MADATAAITAISIAPSDSLNEALRALPPAQTAAPEKSFAVMLTEGLESVSDRLTHANEMVRDFAVDETIPVHQVTIALEEARMGVELATQVRQRLLEGYREIMNMQL